MMPTGSVTYTTPDGVERALRFTLGARKRIAERFGTPNILQALEKLGDGALPEMAHAMMYDAQGKPPAGLKLEEFAEAVDDAPPLLAAIMAAITKGAAQKNELEALLRAQMDQIGANFGPSPVSASDSPQTNSGISQSENSMPSLSDSKSASESPTTAPES